MSLTITAVTPTDVDAVAALAKEIWNQHYPGIISQAQIDYMLDQRYNRARLLAELAVPEIAWDQAFSEGRRVGFSSTHRLEDGTFKLDKIYVHPDMQGRGIGAALVAHAAARAVAAGGTALALAVNKENRRAITAYERLGFVVVDAARVDIGGGFFMDDFLMRKLL